MPAEDIPNVRRAFERIADLKASLEHGLEGSVPIPDDASDERLDTMRELCLSVEFSDHWKKFVAANAWKAAFRLAGSHSSGNMSQRWKGMDEDERLEFLSDFARMQAELFSDKTLQFSPTAILSGSLGDSGAFEFTDDALNDPSENSIALKNIKDISYEDAIIYGWHEQLHGLNFQLASALHRGLIPEEHAFYQDAVMMKEKIQALAHVSARYPTRIYRAEVEERLCYSSQDDFYKAYLQNQGLFNQPPPHGVR